MNNPRTEQWKLEQKLKSLPPPPPCGMVHHELCEKKSVCKCTCPTCALFTPIGPLRPEIEEELREEQIKKINELAQKIQKVEPSEIANKEPWKEIS